VLAVVLVVSVTELLVGEETVDADDDDDDDEEERDDEGGDDGFASTLKEIRWVRKKE
jgi:hypothetical protein